METKTISTKEWLYIILCIIVVSLIVLWNMESFIDKDLIREYQTAVRVDNGSHLRYLNEVRAGNIISYGKVQATDTVTFDELKGEFLYVEKVTSRYTQKSKLECSDWDEDGNCTQWNTVIYYEWDVIDRDKRKSSQISIIGVPFSSNYISTDFYFILEINEETVQPSWINRIGTFGYNLYENDSIFDSVGDLRYNYYFIPKDFNATIFSRFYVNKPDELIVYFEKHPDDVIESVTSGEKNKAVVMFWISIFVAVILLILLFIEIDIEVICK